MNFDAKMNVKFLLKKWEKICKKTKDILDVNKTLNFDDLHDTEILYSASLSLIALLPMTSGQKLWFVSLNMYMNCGIYLLLTEDKCKSNIVTIMFFLSCTYINMFEISILHCIVWI